MPPQLPPAGTPAGPPDAPLCRKAAKLGSCRMVARGVLPCRLGARLLKRLRPLKGVRAVAAETRGRRGGLGWGAQAASDRDGAEELS